MQYFPTSGFLFIDLAQKASFFLSLMSPNSVWATMCMKDTAVNTGGLLPSNSPV